MATTQESGGLNVGYYDANTFTRVECRSGFTDRKNYKELGTFITHLNTNEFFLLTYRNCQEKVAKDYICERSSYEQYP